MTDPSTLLHRIEQATEGSRELDALIEVAAAAKDFGALAEGYRLELEAHPDGISVNVNAMDGKHSSRQKRYAPPHYTTSLDAALTLIPEGWRVLNLSEWDAEPLRLLGPWMCQVRPREHRANIFEGFGEGPNCMHAPTAALALCRAALKARATVSGKTK